MERICFHKNLNDQIQEMLIFHNKKIKIKSHKQNKSSVSYHIYEGSINIVTYDKNNKIIKSLEHKVKIIESKPISKLKTWQVIEKWYRYKQN